MNISRKDFIGGMIAAGTVPMMSGCTTVPTTDDIYTVSLAIGYAAGKIGNMIKMEDKTRNIVVDILNECQYVVPEVGETFTDKWGKIADAHIKVLVDAGTITAQEGDLIKTGVLVITKGLDLVFVRYPKAATYKDLVVSAINGFCKGFLEVFKPVNPEALGAAKIGEKMDKDAYMYLRSLPQVDKAINR